jgi:hypothetical protein
MQESKLNQEQIEEFMSQVCNPLGLTEDDLYAAGWEFNGETWFSSEFGEQTFLGATTCEASRIGLCSNPQDLEKLAW